MRSNTKRLKTFKIHYYNFLFDEITLKMILSKVANTEKWFVASILKEKPRLIMFAINQLYTGIFYLNYRKRLIE